MDLGTGLAVLGGAGLGKDLIIKMLGPTAEYLGGGLKDFTQKRVETIQDIFKNGAKKVGDKIDEKASVPPKVLRGILDEGSFADDFLSVDYFGGVLASSRTGISRDDRGAFFNALISRLSTYQLRLHYIFYHSLKQIFNGEDINWGQAAERSKMKVFIPFSSFLVAMDFTNDESRQFSTILDHAINGLLRENLIDNWFHYGPLDYIKSHFPKAVEGGVILQPNRMGFELFYWAYGKGQDNPKDFLKESVIFELDGKVRLDSRITRVVDKPNEQQK